MTMHHSTTPIAEHAFPDRPFAFDSWINVIDFSLPHLYLLVAYFSVLTRRKSLGGVAALLGVKSYVEVAQAYHLHWQGTTALMCMAYVYGAMKSCELGLVMLLNREHDYDDQDSTKAAPVTLSERILWTLKAASNLRCIGFRGGMRESKSPPAAAAAAVSARPTRRAILGPALLKLGSVDVLTSMLHHLACHDAHLPAIARPWWQQCAIAVLLGVALFHLLQGSYGCFHYVGIYWLAMPASQWPPLMQSPWAAQSLAQFWSREWHAVFRRIFTFYTDLAVTPLSTHLQLSKTVQRAVTILVVFMVSAFLHNAGLYLVSGQQWPRTILFFVLQGPALLLESHFDLARRPLLGRLWTYSFLLITVAPIGMIGDVIDYGAPYGSILTDGFFRDVSITSRIVNYCFNTHF